MSVTAETLFELVEAPVGVPYRFGLFSVLDFDNLGEHAGLGVTWESQACATVGITNDVCVDPARTAYTEADYCHVGQATPFTVYVYDTDSIGQLPTSAHRERARNRFLAVEQNGAEAGLETRLAAAATPVASTFGVSPTEKLLVAVAQVENDLAAISGHGGVIFMGRYAASLLAAELRVSGGRLSTVLGTPVVAMTAIDTAASQPTTLTVYGTGPLVAHRGEINVVDASGARRENDTAVIAERTYAIGWDCGIVAATATL